MSSTDVPVWIFVWGALLSAIGMIAGTIGIFSPTMFFSDFPDFSQWEEISYVTAGWGVRNIAMGVAMIIALALELPSAIGALFAMRFVTELGDLVNTLYTGHGSFNMPKILVAVVWIGVFLVPEALATRWGIYHALNDKDKYD